MTHAVLSSLLGPPTPDLLARAEAAAYLGLKPQTLAVWALTGRYGLPVTQSGRNVRYRRRDLDAWLDSRTVGGMDAR